MKKTAFARLALSLVFVALRCAQLPTGDGSGSHTGNPGLTGHLIDGRNGMAADSATVRIYPVYLNKMAQVLGKTADVVPAIDSTFTDQTGLYRFQSLNEGIYSLEAEKVDAGDTLYMRRSGVLYSGTKDLGYDTLHRPGSITGKVAVPGGESPKNVTCFLPGTSYIAITNDTGGFRITGIPAGLYSLSVMSDRFNDTTLYNKRVSPDSETDIGPIALTIDRSKNEHDVWGFFDTSSDYRSIGRIEARVSGDSIPADTPRIYGLDWRPDIPGYSGFIYVPGSGIFWKVAVWVFDSLDHRIGLYQMVINRSTGDIQVPAFNPRNAVPVVTLRDTAVSINDTIRLNPAIVTLPDDSIVSMEWKIGTAGAFALTRNKDTAFAAPASSGLLPCLFRVINRFGVSIADTVIDTIVVDPPIFSLGHDTIVNVGSSVTFNAVVHQRFGTVVMYTWSCAGDTAWTDSGNLPAKGVFFRKPGEQKIMCSVRDDDGNTTGDTIAVTVVTEIDGTIPGSMTLQESASPYRIKTLLLVPAGTALTIEAGVKLMGSMDVYGGLDARGTGAKRIVWTSPFGLRLSKDASCTLKFCDMIDSGGISCFPPDTADTVIIDSCRLQGIWLFSQQHGAGLLRGCEFSGGSVYLVGDNWVVEGNRLDLSAYAYGVDCPGMKAQGTNALVSSNVISGSGILWRSGTGGTISSNVVSGGGYIWCDDGVDTIAGNTVNYSNKDGIRSGTTRTVINNAVENCNGSGITGTGAAQEICSNTLVDNRGFGIYTESDSCIIRHNTVTGSGPYSAPWILPYFYAGVVCMNPFCTIDSNVITGNANGAICRSGCSLVNNNIHDNWDYDFRVMFGDSSDVDVSNNWWGTADTAQIQLKIYDFSDDSGVGKALIAPVAVDSIPGAGAR
jgi:parallel beta-helix repeat protein